MPSNNSPSHRSVASPSKKMSKTPSGILHGHDWRWRKSRHIDEDVAAHPDGIFVAAAGNQVAGYITTRIDREAGKGRIPNLAVAPEFRGQGLGRRLIEHALDYFQREGLAYAMIETMAQNEIGQHLYPACGFVEVARQIHFARDNLNGHV